MKKHHIVKATSMYGSNGNPVPNQIVLQDGSKSVFQSYGTTIAITENGKTVLDPKWDYSMTTRKYCAQFIGADGRADILKRIASGEFIVKNLN